ncbi:MAG TPA: nucleoside hydrolase [Phycisphaerae bacterium]|nr:nucleoside hydrolase [Phycisphaerae bacterium]
MTTPRNFLIDTDVASDDAVALIMALRSPDITVRGITTVAGNVPLHQATQNALLVTELCNQPTIPVHAGCSKPLLRQPSDATWFHGNDGLGDLHFHPTKRTAPNPTHAIDALLTLSREHPNSTLVTLGPLTNIAAALLRDPSFAHRIARCVIMGGNPCCVGNVTPAAEYNIWCDPEAAEIVLRSGMNCELVGWHLCRGQAALNATEIAQIKSLNTPLANFAIDCNRTAADAYLKQTGETGISLPDPTAMAIALDPSIATHASSHPVKIECASELTRGQTLVDQLNVSTDPRNAPTWSNATTPTRIIWSLNIPAFKKLLLASLHP